MLKKIVVVMSTVIILLGLLPGCGSSSPSTSGSTNPYGSSSNTPSNETKPTVGAQSISIKGFAFSPKELSINKGDTVTWTNEDKTVHNVVGGILKSKDLTTGQSFSYTFSEAGTYDYICTYHPSMKASILVK